MDVMVGTKLVLCISNTQLPMKRSLLLIPFTCMVVFVGLLSFSPSNSTGLEEEVFKQTNQFRRSKGLSALIMRKELNAIAQEHSNNMARGRVAFGHGGFDQRNVMAKNKIRSLSSFAENVAYGARSATEVMNLWKNSSGHRRNLLGRYQYFGIGIAKDRQGRLFYTQVFGG
jgi:uncharacterized protein YkwD